MHRLLTASLVTPRRGAGQDRVVVRHTTNGANLVLADGAGGTGGGAIAAELGCALAAERLLTSSTAEPVAVLDEIDAALSSETNAGETTLVVARVSDGLISGASVGDSEAWLLTSDGLFDRTAAQARKPLLGSGKARAKGFVADLAETTLLIASDGLFKYAQPTQIGTIIRGAADLHSAAERLVNAVRLPSGALQDDVSLILARRGR